MSEGMQPDGPDSHPVMAALYDFENPWGRADEFFLAVVSRQGASRVLDLGCGTGTATIAFARAGHTVVGVDPNPAFIEAARSKPGAELVTWICGTSTDIPAGTFDTVVLMGHVVQAFVDDDEWSALLACLKRALAPGGTLVFDSRDPDCRGWEAWQGAWTGELPGHGPVQSSARVIGVDGDVVTFEVDTRGPHADSSKCCRGVVVHDRDVRRMLAASIREFCGDVDEFWAWCPTVGNLEASFGPADASDAHARYWDWDLQLIHRVVQPWPRGWPTELHELNEAARRVALEVPPNESAHRPRDDARWNLRVFELIQGRRG